MRNTYIKKVEWNTKERRNKNRDGGRDGDGK